MNRLYLQIYVSVLAVILLFALLAASAFWLFEGESEQSDWLQQMQVFAEAVIPPTDAPPERLRRFAEAIAEPFDVDVTIYDASGGILVRLGRRVPAPPATGGSRWIRQHGRHGAIALAIGDGRWIIMEGERHRRPLLHLFIAIAILTVATGIAVFPLVRRLTRRLDAPEQRYEREPVDLLALAAEEAARLEGVEVHGVSRSIDGDPRLLRRLVRNLLENALRHGEAPVEVEVQAGHDPNWVNLVVADRGPGIPESERERIFDPFYRPLGQASSEGGIGLGLALVRQIAERHAGRIRCESRVGGGTRFVLELPGSGN